MRRIIAYLATSVDGFIARADGSVDWLDRPRPRGNYGMGAFIHSIDTVVMGRATYDVGVKLGAPIWSGAKNIILSRTLAPDAVKDATVEKGDARELADRWRKEEGRDIWLMGGAKVFGEFLDAGALDEMIIHIVPVVIGTGIPLLDAKRRTSPLKLVSTRKFSDGVVRVHYSVTPT